MNGMLLRKWIMKQVPDYAMLPAELSGFVYCLPYTGFNSSYGVIAAIHVCDEHARLDADRRFHIQPA